MKTQQSVEETIMQILNENLQLDMPRPVAARKKVTKEIIELFDQQTANLKLINEKQSELIKNLTEQLFIGEPTTYEIEAKFYALFAKETALRKELQSLQEEKEKCQRLQDQTDGMCPDCLKDHYEGRNV